jgi:sugar-specific transcriptional regulator TrmB
VTAEKLTATQASTLLGIPYEVVLRYARQLEHRGLVSAQSIEKTAGCCFLPRIWIC